MAKMTDEEKAQLKALQEKSEAPDEPAPNRMTNITIDLSDENAVKRAVKMGLLDPFEDDDDADDDADDTDDDDADDVPARKGYFGGK